MEVPDLNISSEEVKNICLRYFHESNAENLEVLRCEYHSAGYRSTEIIWRRYILKFFVTEKLNECKASFYVKIASSSEQSSSDHVDLLPKEGNVYWQVLARLQNVNIGCENFSSMCYLAKPNVLVFEDLADQGFRRAANREGILDFDHLLCALKTLANLHAASIVLESRTRKTIPELFKECTKETAYPEDPNCPRRMFVMNTITAFTDMIKEIPKYAESSDFVKIVDKLPETFLSIFEYCKPSKQWMNTFNHGSLCGNSLMFLYDACCSLGEGRSTDCRMTSFQLARYSPPMLDVITLITATTTSEFRKIHLKNLLDNYHYFLGQFLQRHSIDAEEVLPKIQFNECADHFRLAGLLESSMIYHSHLLSESIPTNHLGTVESVNKYLADNTYSFAMKSFQSDQIYREKVTDLLSEIVDSHILQEEILITRL